MKPRKMFWGIIAYGIVGMLGLASTALARKPTSVCGNSIAEPGEGCDGSDFRGATCESEGFTGGTLACTPTCQVDESGCFCAPGAAFPATGQTTSFKADDDGDVQAGATLSYTDNADGTITDNNTGLVWEKKSDDGSIHDKDNVSTWNEAFDVHVAGLNTASFAGHSDWRVPNVKELQSIVNYGTFNPAVVSPAFNTDCAPACTVLTCSCTAASFYWSSTSLAGNPLLAWDVLFVSGIVDAFVKSDPNHVRAVRGGS